MGRANGAWPKSSAATRDVAGPFPCLEEIFFANKKQEQIAFEESSVVFLSQSHSENLR
jgi:hypothetical protein